MTNDYIKREDAENKFAKIITGDIFKEIKEDAKKSVAKDFFSDIPTADVVEVVRCKDCIYKEECGREVLVNEYDDDKAVDITGFLFYCSYGERADT